MDLVPLDFFLMDGLECAEPYIQGDRGDFDAALPELRKNLGREMQPRRGRGYRSGMIREDGLVALAIGGIVFA